MFFPQCITCGVAFDKACLLMYNCHSNSIWLYRRRTNLDFYQATQDTMRNLNKNEMTIYEYVIKNMSTVKNMSIQKLASQLYVSTTTVFRFAQKLGFAGYSELINCLLITTHNDNSATIPVIVTGESYNDMYIKNAIEAVRVMSHQYVKDIIQKLKHNPHIYILCDDNTHTIGQYAEKLFIGLGFKVYFPEAAYQMQMLANQVESNDMIIALSYTGEDAVLGGFIKRVFLHTKPFLVSITRADNNELELLSDANFYVFAEEIKMNGIDLTSCVPMLMILELLAYEYMGNN